MKFQKAGTIRHQYPSDWPPKEYYVLQGDVTRAQLETFKNLVNSNASESQIDLFLQNNLPVLACCLTFFRTGHHGTWIIPQQMIRPPRNSVEPGLKPDYLLGGRNSEGFTWSVLDSVDPNLL